MSGKEPSAKELKRALRFLRHLETCDRCGFTTTPLCHTGYGHYACWNDIYYIEVLGACKHGNTRVCGAQDCAGGTKR